MPLLGRTRSRYRQSDSCCCAPKWSTSQAGRYGDRPTARTAWRAASDSAVRVRIRQAVPRRAAIAS